MAYSVWYRRIRFLLFKFVTLLTLVRWYNILLIWISQYLAAIFILKPELSWLAILKDVKIHLVTFSTAFSIASGYIINSFYDLEKDLINRPDKTIFNRLISKWFSLNCYFLFNIIGLWLAFLVSFEILFFNILFQGLMWFYSHKLKRIALLGNFMATVLAISPFFSVCIYYGKINELVSIYVAYMFCIELTREIIKDLEAVKGDLIYGYKTVPIIWGTNAARNIIYFLMLCSFVPSFYIFILDGTVAIIYSFLFSVGWILYQAFLLFKAQTIQEYHRVNNNYKVLILIALASIVLI